MIYFVSENNRKFLEYQTILDGMQLSHLKISLTEIQAVNAMEVCKHKLLTAKTSPILKNNSFFIEDTALYFTAWKNFPGVYIKWMLESLGVEKIYQSLTAFKKEAIAECTIGYFCSKTNQTHFFQERVKGNIVSPQVNNQGTEGFGWDPLFVPKDHSQSYAQMSKKQKNLCSHRALAAKKFQQFLQKQN